MCDTILTLVSFSLLHGIGYPFFFTWLTTVHAFWELAVSTDPVVISTISFDRKHLLVSAPGIAHIAYQQADTRDIATKVFVPHCTSLF